MNLPYSSKYSLGELPDSNWSLNFSRCFLADLDRFVGGVINTFTYKSPGLLPCGEIPSPLILKVFPLGVPDGIFNVAAETHVDRSIDDPEIFLKSSLSHHHNFRN